MSVLKSCTKGRPKTCPRVQSPGSFAGPRCPASCLVFQKNPQERDFSQKGAGAAWGNDFETTPSQVTVEPLIHKPRGRESWGARNKGCECNTVSWTQLQSHLTAQVNTAMLQRNASLSQQGKQPFYFSFFFEILVTFNPFRNQTPLLIRQIPVQFLPAQSPSPHQLIPPWMLQAQAAGDACWQTQPWQFFGKYPSIKALQGDQSYLQSFPAGFVIIPAKRRGLLSCWGWCLAPPLSFRYSLPLLNLPLGLQL